MVRRYGWRNLRVLAALIVGLELAACGGQAPPSAATDMQGTAAASTSASTPSAQATGEPFKIGVILPYSGVYAQLGQDITDAMTLYFDSRGNTVAGRPITIIKQDTKADPQVGVQVARALIERDTVDILAGAVSSAVAYGVMDLAQREQIPFVIANATGNKATRGGNKYVFRTSASSWQVSYPMGKYLVDQGVKSIFVSAADYVAGHEMADAFKAGFTEAGGRIVDEVYPPLSTNDYSSFLTRIRQANPPAEWSFYGGSDAVRFVQQRKSYGMEAPLFGPGYLVEADTLPAQKEAAVGVKTALHYMLSLDNAENKAFVASFKATFGRDPSVYAVQGWDTAWLIGEALKATNGNSRDIDALIKAMEGVQFKSPRGPMKLDENHNPVQTIYIREVRAQADGSVQNVLLDTIENVQDPGK